MVKNKELKEMFDYYSKKPINGIVGAYQITK